MPDDWTVLDHLLEGREQLQREVEHLRSEISRLSDAIAGLNAVIGQVNGERRSGGGDGGANRQPTAPLRAGRAATRSASVRAGDGEAPKSIRIHVLEMLGAEDRDFGLAEIIDNIHAAGIQAHDDAVRSITIKLMKDGQVERVGRGQYRLARRGNRSSVSVPPPADEAPADLETQFDETDETPEAELQSDDQTEDQADAQDESGDESQSESDSYTPPLNLGQAWE